MSRLLDSYGFLLAKAKEEMEFGFMEKLLPHGMNARHYGALLLIDEKPFSSQKEIAEGLKIDRTTMVEQADHLEKLGYIQRVRNPNDRRSYCLAITEKGKEMLEIGWKYLEETEQNVLCALTNEEKVLLKNILLKIWGSKKVKEDDNEQT